MKTLNVALVIVPLTPLTLNFRYARASGVPETLFKVVAVPKLVAGTSDCTYASSLAVMGARTAALASAEPFTDLTECRTGRRAGITLTDEGTGSLWEDFAGIL